MRTERMIHIDLINPTCHTTPRHYRDRFVAIGHLASWYVIRNISSTYSCDNAKCARYSVVIRTVQDIQGAVATAGLRLTGPAHGGPDLRRFVPRHRGSRHVRRGHRPTCSGRPVPVLPRSGMLCILPVLFIVLLEPTVLEMVKVFR